MIQKLKKYVHNNPQLKKIIPLIILTEILYAIMLFHTIPKLLKISQGIQILDMLPLGYSPKYVNDLFVALSEVGRNIYLTQQIPLDMLYPGLFAISFSLLISFLFKKIREKNQKENNNSRNKLYLIPFVAAMFDYSENIGIIIMLKIYPLFHPKLAMIVNMFSILKFTSYTISMCIIVYAISTLIIKKKRIK